MGKTLPKDQGSSDTQKKTGQQEIATVPILKSGNIAKNLSEVPWGSHIAKNLVKCTTLTAPSPLRKAENIFKEKQTKKDSKTNKF